jgi:hypothetical protein
MARFRSVIKGESPAPVVSFKENEKSLKEIRVAEGLHWQKLRNHE